MKTNSAVLSFLAANKEFDRAEIYTIALLTDLSHPLRWTTGDTDLTVGGHTFTKSGGSGAPLVGRGSVHSAADLSIGSLEVDLEVSPAVLLGGRPMALAAAQGVFYGANVLVEELIMPTWGDVSLGTVWLFEGNVSEVEANATAIKLTVKDSLERLNIQMPRRLVEPGCPHQFCGAACGLTAATYTDARTVQSGATASSIPIDGGRANGYFDLGVATFTSGAAAGLSRTVLSYASGVLTLAVPLPVAPVATDSVSVIRGCAKTWAACQAYSNDQRFGGFPFVPMPESVR